MAERARRDGRGAGARARRRGIASAGSLRPRRSPPLVTFLASPKSVAHQRRPRSSPAAAHAGRSITDQRPRISGSRRCRTSERRNALSRESGRLPSAGSNSASAAPAKPVSERAGVVDRAVILRRSPITRSIRSSGRQSRALAGRPDQRQRHVAVGERRGPQQVDQHQGRLALDHVAPEVLAVGLGAVGDVLDVIADLEHRAERTRSGRRRRASVPREPSSAPTRHGWIAVYQHVLSSASLRYSSESSPGARARATPARPPGPRSSAASSGRTPPAPRARAGADVSRSRVAARTTPTPARRPR